MVDLNKIWTLVGCLYLLFLYAMWYFFLYFWRENEDAYSCHHLCSLQKLCLLTIGDFHENI